MKPSIRKQSISQRCSQKFGGRANFFSAILGGEFVRQMGVCGGNGRLGAKPPPCSRFRKIRSGRAGRQALGSNPRAPPRKRVSALWAIRRPNCRLSFPILRCPRPCGPRGFLSCQAPIRGRRTLHRQAQLRPRRGFRLCARRTSSREWGL